MRKHLQILLVFGRYLLTGKIFKYLEEVKPEKVEIQLTDAILDMLKWRKKVLSYNFEGKRYDIGNKVGLLKAI